MTEYYGAPNDFRNYIQHDSLTSNAQVNVTFNQLKNAVNNAGLGNLRAASSWSLNELQRRIANNPSAVSSINPILNRLKSARVERSISYPTPHSTIMVIDFNRTKIGDSSPTFILSKGAPAAKIRR